MRLKTKFQDKDFELGEVTDVDITTTPNGRIEVYARTKRGILVVKSYNSISEFISDWEDVPEESKGSALDLMILTLTNFIENEPDEDKVDLEDCKQVLEKLKAWQNIKKDLDKINWQPEEGDKFSIWGSFIPSSLLRDGAVLDDHREDLDILIGRSEE